MGDANFPIVNNINIRDNGNTLIRKDNNEPIDIIKNDETNIKESNLIYNNIEPNILYLPHSIEQHREYGYMMEDNCKEILKLRQRKDYNGYEDSIFIDNITSNEERYDELIASTFEHESGLIPYSAIICCNDRIFEEAYDGSEYLIPYIAMQYNRIVNTIKIIDFKTINHMKNYNTLLFTLFYKHITLNIKHVANKEILMYYIYPRCICRCNLLFTFLEEKKKKEVYLIYGADNIIIFYKICISTLKLTYTYEFETDKYEKNDYSLIGLSNIILFSNVDLYYSKMLIKMPSSFTLLPKSSIKKRTRLCNLYRTKLNLIIFMIYSKKKLLFLPSELYEYIFSDILV